MQITKRGKIITVLIIIAALGISAYTLLLPRILLMREINSLAQQSPYLSVVPTKIKIPFTPCQLNDCYKFSGLGASFSIPTSGNVTTTISYMKNQELISLPTGIKLFFVKDDNLLQDLVNSIPATSSKSEIIKRFLEINNITNNYEFYRATLYTTPGSVKLTSSLDSLTGTNILLIAKSAINVTGPAIYEFSAPQVKGFEMIDPPMTRMEVFTSSGQAYYLAAANGLSQQDVYVILSSFTPF